MLGFVNRARQKEQASVRRESKASVAAARRPAPLSRADQRHGAAMRCRQRFRSHGGVAAPRSSTLRWASAVPGPRQRLGTPGAWVWAASAPRTAAHSTPEGNTPDTGETGSPSRLRPLALLAGSARSAIAALHGHSKTKGAPTATPRTATCEVHHPLALAVHPRRRRNAWRTRARG